MCYVSPLFRISVYLMSLCQRNSLPLADQALQHFGQGHSHISKISFHPSFFLIFFSLLLSQGLTFEGQSDFCVQLVAKPGTTLKNVTATKIKQHNKNLGQNLVPSDNRQSCCCSLFYCQEYTEFPHILVKSTIHVCITWL